MKKYVFYQVTVSAEENEGLARRGVVGWGGRHCVEWQGRPQDKVTLEQRPAGGKGVSPVAAGGEGSPAGGASQYKSPQVGVCSQLTIQQQLHLWPLGMFVECLLVCQVVGKPCLTTPSGRLYYYHTCFIGKEIKASAATS